MKKSFAQDELLVNILVPMVSGAHGSSVSGDGAQPWDVRQTAAVCCARQQPVYGLDAQWCGSLR